MGDNLNAIFLKNVKIDPQEYVLQGSPPYTIYKNSKNIERTLFRWAKIKTRIYWKTSKKNLRNTFYRGPPPSTIYYYSKNIVWNLFLWAIIKARLFWKPSI